MSCICIAEMVEAHNTMRYYIVYLPREGNALFSYLRRIFKVGTDEFNASFNAVATLHNTYIAHNTLCNGIIHNSLGT